MLPKILLVVFSSLLFACCLRPDKPIVEQCQIDFPAAQGICAMTGGGANTQINRQPLSNLDKASCFKPADYKKVKDYIDLMEAYATDLEKNCK